MIFELSFGIWLLSGLLQKSAWLVSLILFTGFAGVSLYKGAILQETSCGCLGTVQVNPCITMTLDLTIVGFLAAFRPKEIIFHRQTFFRELTGLKLSKHFFVTVGIWLIVALPVTYAILSVQKNEMTELGTEFISIDGKKTILIDPEKWVGKEFPLLPYIEPIEVREKLKTGEWTVVLYHHDCPKCKKVIDGLIEKKTKNLICLEMPPFGKERLEQTDFEHARFVVSQKLLVETPVVIDLNDAFVTY